ncbi:MAG: class I SAM-dependent methyltransferase [Promethearchaeota archaeon]
MTETDQYMQRLYVTDPLREPVLRAAIGVLHLPEGSRGLDAGCGIGLQVPLLAEAVGPSGHVTGLDLRPEFLVEAERIAEESGLSGQVFFQQGDVNKLPFEHDTFDWIWSASCVGYGFEEPLPLVKELVRVVRPGGIVAILVYSSQMLLPGYPLLEARLNATATGIAPFTKSMRPESHWLRALGWFGDAGLKEATARTFVSDFHAPLSGEIRDALIALFEMRWDGAESEVTAADWAEYQRLCQPDSADFILDRPDYYAFFTETLFHGKVAK